MQIKSVQVSLAKSVLWNGRTIKTGIFKEPVSTPVSIQKEKMEGDVSVDTKHHGGEFQAVYSYAFEHYPIWEKQRGKKLTPGIFGENITTVGLDENVVNVGDEYLFGEALLQATLPRFPCFKLGIVFEDQGIIDEFVENRLTGIYWRVLKEGKVKSGDKVILEKHDAGGLSISDVFLMYCGELRDPEVLKRAYSSKVVAPSLKRKIERWLGE